MLGGHPSYFAAAQYPGDRRVFPLYYSLLQALRYTHTSVSVAQFCLINLHLVVVQMFTRSPANGVVVFLCHMYVSREHAANVAALYHRLPETPYRSTLNAAMKMTTRSV